MSSLFNKNIISSVILLIFSGFSILSGQKITKDEGTEKIFIARVKQFSEFTGRFNLLIDFSGKPADSLFKAKMPREKMIPALFDLNDSRILPGNKNHSEDFIRIKKDFIKEVIEKKMVLDQYSSGIIAETKSKVSINGKPQIISIFLNQEVSESNRIKWVIISVKGIFPEMFKNDSSMIRFIPPASNETAFLNLKRALEDTGHLQDYAYSGFEPDYLSLFFYCINSGIIKYEYSEEIIYHIISIPGWYFTVKDFNRNEMNSGWLISDLFRNNYNLNDFIRKSL